MFISCDKLNMLMLGCLLSSKLSEIQTENDEMVQKQEQTQKELDSSKKEIEQLKEELTKARQDTGYVSAESNNGKYESKTYSLSKELEDLQMSSECWKQKLQEGNFEMIV